MTVFLSFTVLLCKLHSTFTSARSSPLPHFAEFSIGETASLGDTFNLEWETTTHPWQSFENCRPGLEAIPCINVTNISMSVPYTGKFATWSDAHKRVITNLAVDGYSATEYDGDEASSESIQFVVGSARSTLQKSISGFTAIRLESFAKQLLTQSPAEFVGFFGQLFITEQVFGFKFRCQYSLQGEHSSDYGYLKKLFSPITEDVFSNESMSDDFMARVNEARQAKRLNWPNLDCDISGQSPEISQFASPFELGQIFQNWTDTMQVHPLGLRASLQRIADVQDVKDAMLNQTAAEQAPLSNVSLITANTTAELTIALAASSFVSFSARVSKDYQCARANRTLFDAFSWFEYFAAKAKNKQGYLNSSSMSDIQRQLSAGTYIGLDGDRLVDNFSSWRDQCGTWVDVLV